MQDGLEKGELVVYDDSEDKHDDDDDDEYI